MSPSKPVGLVAEFLRNPQCLETRKPRLSWRLDDPRHGARQTAFRIVAASSEERLEAEDPDCWDTGHVASAETLDIAWAGRALKSRSEVFWRVMVWDADGAPSAWSETASFGIGPFGSGDLCAKWIGAAAPRTREGMPVPMFRKSFQLPAAPSKAHLHVSAFGLAEVTVNGRPAGADLFAPGWTDYRHHVELVTYDATPLLRAGENVVGALLGEGWFAGNLTWEGRNKWGDSPALLVELDMEFPDGGRMTVSTDETWLYTEDGPVRSSDLYQGEVYDARCEIPGWDEPGFAARSWRRAVRIAVPEGARLCGRPNGGIRRQKALAPISRAEPLPGRYVFDLGQNMVGFPHLELRGRPGGTITVRYAEMLNPDGTLYNANYRSARSVDTYVCRGAGPDGAPETHEPRFTFHGFRYIELSGDFETPPECGDVAGIVVHSDMEQTGSFECSDPVANRLFSNINWGQAGNFIDVPTDCPQRDERLGWTGDAQVFARTAAYNRDVAGFFAKWARDLEDGQFPDGAFPDVAPNMLGPGCRGHCGWGDAGVVCPWTMFEMFGDTEILRRHYDSMVRWLGWWKGLCTEEGVVRYAGGIWHYGDWLSVDCPVDEDGRPQCGAAPTPSDLLATAYYARCAGIVADVARVLGKTDDARAFAALRRKIAAAYRREFVTPGGRVAGDTQTGYLVTLGFGLVEDPHVVARMVERLVFLVESRDNALTTGFLGTPLLCPVLTRFGRADLAYKLFQRKKYPSWYFPILDGGATTMWERWNSYSSRHGFGDVSMNSFNHYAYGAIGEWMYETVGGIAPAEPGFRKIRFAPVPGGDITWAHASLATRRGMASIEWRLKPGGNIDVSVLVPPNTTAELVLPGNGPRELSAGRHSVTAALPAPAVHPLDAAREKLARRIERHVAGATAFAAGRCELAAASLPDASRVRRGEWVEKWPRGNGMAAIRVRGEVWTDAIQAALNARGCVHVPARKAPYYLDSPIVLGPGQTLVADPGAEFRLVPGTDTCLLRNSSVVGMDPQSLAIPDVPLDEGLYVEGGVWTSLLTAPDERNGNLWGHVSKSAPVHGCYGAFVFNHVRGLVVRNVTIRQCNMHGIQLSDAHDFLVDGVVFDRQGRDGVHVHGASDWGVIRRVAGDTRDDFIALNAWDWSHTSPTHGPIRNVVVEDSECVNAPDGDRPEGCCAIRIQPGNRPRPVGGTLACPVESVVFRRLSNVRVFKMYDQPNLELGRDKDRSEPIGTMRDLFFDSLSFDRACAFEIADNLHGCDISRVHFSYDAGETPLVSIRPKSGTWKHDPADPSTWVEIYSPDEDFSVRGLSTRLFTIRRGGRDIPADAGSFVHVENGRLNPDWPATTPRGGTGKVSFSWRREGASAGRIPKTWKKSK